MTTESQQQIAREAADEIHDGGIRCRSALNQIILSAIERAVKEVREPSEIAGIKVRWPSAQPQRSEQQEWTPLLQQVGLDIRLYAYDNTVSWQYLVRLCNSEPSARLHTPRFVEAVNREVNRRITAERQKLDEFYIAARMADKRELAAECQRREQLIEQRKREVIRDGKLITGLRDKLLSALAAIEKLRRVLKHFSLPKDMEDALNVDLSLLREHDEQIRLECHFSSTNRGQGEKLLAEHDAEVRKPLVEALERVRAVIVDVEQNLIELPSTTARTIIESALAKVKER